MIAIIDYKAGNLTSVGRALDSLGVENVITSDPLAILDADRIIFPGVGAAGEAMSNLRRLGLDEVIKNVFYEGKPVLGICVGTQVIMEYSEENDTDCLGLVPGRVVKFPASFKDSNGAALKVPHMGWNQVSWKRDHPALRGIASGMDYYFVHSYYPQPADESATLGETEYGVKFTSIIGYRNLIAVQFHAEKSGPVGLQLLKNFSQWDGKTAD